MTNSDVAAKILSLLQAENLPSDFEERLRATDAEELTSKLMLLEQLGTKGRQLLNSRSASPEQERSISNRQQKRTEILSRMKHAINEFALSPTFENLNVAVVVTSSKSKVSKPAKRISRADWISVVQELRERMRDIARGLPTPEPTLLLSTPVSERVKIRLAHNGAFFNVVVVDTSHRQVGRYIETLGFYKPEDTSDVVGLSIDLDKVKFLQDVGVKSSPKAVRLIEKMARIKTEKI